MKLINDFIKGLECCELNLNIPKNCIECPYLYLYKEKEHCKRVLMQDIYNYLKELARED